MKGEEMMNRRGDDSVVGIVSGVILALGAS